MQNLYPLFERNRILKKELLWSLRDYSFSHVQLEYQEYSQGILQGCQIQVEGSELIVGPGMIKYGGFICLIKEEAANAAEEKREIVCLPHISPYSLRRTGLTRMSESGINAKTLQVIAGHAKIETTYNYYVQVTDDFYKEDMKKFFIYKKQFEEEFRISF